MPKLTIPSYIKNPPTGSNMPNPSVHATPSNITPNPKRSKIRMLLFALAIVILGAAAGYYFFIYTNDNTENNVNLNVTVNTSNINNAINNGGVTNNNTNVSSINNTLINTKLNTNSVQNNNLVTNFENSGIVTKTIDGQTVDWIDYLLGDYDGDGVDNGVERTYGTNINKIDSDDDGYNDKDEIGSCYNPVSGGEMDGEYFANIYCFIDSKQIVDIAGESLEQKEALIKKHNDLCKDWTLFADEVMTSKIAGENIGLLFTLANENYNESCKKMQEKYNNGLLDDVIKKFAFGASNAEDLCDEFSYKIRFMCGEETGY